jgi:hypothetical protein
VSQPPCGCDWPDHLHPECAVHGIVKNCACGEYHATMPLFEVTDGYYVPAVCRKHLRHIPCRGCAREVERLAEVIIYGAVQTHRDLRTGPTETQ